MIFEALDPDMPEDEIEQIISEVDEDGSGTVDYEGMSHIVFLLECPSPHFFVFVHRILQIDDWLDAIEIRHISRVYYRTRLYFLFSFFDK